MSRANLWNLLTDAGRLDLVFKPSGTEGYDDLARTALTYEVFGVEVRAACGIDRLARSRPEQRARSSSGRDSR